MTEKEFDKAVQQSSDNHSRLSSLFRDAAGVEPKILNPDVKRSTGWDIDFDSLEVKAGYGGGVNIFADVGNSSSAKILTAYMYYWSL